MEQQQAALRSRFGAMDTSHLMQMWSEQGLAPWAETVLREELQARGTDEASLQQASKLRQAPPLPQPLSIMETFMMYGALGSFGCAVFAMALQKILTATVGSATAYIVILVTLAAYLVILIRRLLAHGGQSNSIGTSFLLAILWLKAGMFSLLGLVGLATMVLR
ncbi:hypothetical protein ABB26_13680 [Stenotrophomonas humi]|uniref:Uncharacterized protein n=1 Tax=Stenotrophomonas humi TaxID=405444 RepID=A0A0R0BZ89_9GAMM|nr:hypothetical protein [Stenotrophomonas humi]KRG63037.1 hypothetical protein ABB26_13680 [Stenotrophomonas humi]